MTAHRADVPGANVCRLAYCHNMIQSLLYRLGVLQAGTCLNFCRPGLRYGASPVRLDSTDRRSMLDRLLVRGLSFASRSQYTEQRSSSWLNDLSKRINSLKALTPIQCNANRAELLRRMRHEKITEDTLDGALAHACLAVEYAMGWVPRANQRLAARAMLRGYCVEMATGEGKTLSIALAAAAAAMSGTPVHVLTANDYLAARDAVTLKLLYQFLGIRVSSVLSNSQAADRRLAYAADIVYVTAKQIASDWLSDVLELGTRPESVAARLTALTRTSSDKACTPVLRGLCLAIVDEADSLFVDEARIPLVLAMAQADMPDVDTQAVVALGLAEQLREGVDYHVQSTTRFVELTVTGQSELLKLSERVAHVWQSARYREEIVGQALTVLHRFERDRDYIVRDGHLELLDAHTGRAVPDRRLPHGMQRLLEIKENCTPSAQHETVATLSFQHFFVRYLGLVGISGTLADVSGEIHQLYGCLFVRVPPHRRSRRLNLPSVVFPDRSVQLQAMVDNVRRRQELAQPVLVCTRSVEQSLGVSAMLSAHGVSHNVLNAYQDAEEAAIVATAGQPGQVTVATNMAGRGTDIPLGEAVSELGGLHVISLAFNDSRRLDHQLAGRAARQGDPGSCQQMLSLDDPYLIDAMPSVLLKCARFCVEKQWTRLCLIFVRLAQKRMEWKHREDRLELFRSRGQLERQLAFGGQQEKQA